MWSMAAGAATWGQSGIVGDNVGPIPEFWVALPVPREKVRLEEHSFRRPRTKPAWIAAVILAATCVSTTQCLAERQELQLAPPTQRPGAATADSGPTVSRG